jgi:hypothetical protein
MARRKTLPPPAAMVGIEIGFGAFSGREPVAPESFTRSQSTPNVDWEGLYGTPENPNGFTATNPNGSQHDQGNGDNQRPYWSENRGNGQRWSPPVNWNGPGRRNRTGE